ncbi:hypothetical protein CEUSTIGMA_g8352.t1 [Chlamydomonas eustigma]|uniref:Response regulatory domain-containing protein n=1 Tax=Chlamydomonas eustigma TaxID=1157962 RepID=A0A250XCU9_9CHLO|nr:hypothetical protein CEUSTIGMA_g8352.t1 [Chlamydomonas eustigma]|eukprot:GAX80917.1 hypothetical protein CEUSTIGMA_g8352.t1 [Chlamydomonas eustigma]
MEAAPTANRRRLPTKTRSGIITLPPTVSGDDEESITISPVMISSRFQASSLDIKSSTLSNIPLRPKEDEPCSVCHSDNIPTENPAGLTSNSLRVESGLHVGSSTSRLQDESSRPKTIGYGPPKQVPKPPPLKTGPLNSTSTPQAHALPVTRRGSYQSLKKQPSGGVRSEDTTSIMGMLKKATHWERFGTILALVCMSNDTPDGKEVLQMLQAEGYDTGVVGCSRDAVAEFSSGEVFPDVVLVDADLPAFGSTAQLIKQLQVQNATVAIVVLGSQGGKVDAVSALQAGAADFMLKPLDLDEMVARIERHVQRQHSIKLELERAMEEARVLMAKLEVATRAGSMVLGKTAPSSSAAGHGAEGGKVVLGPVAETDFEEQIMELSDENQRLGKKIQDMEQKLLHKDDENRRLEQKLNKMEVRMDNESSGVQGQLCAVNNNNSVLMHKVDELERLVRSSGGTSAVQSSTTSNRNSTSNMYNSGSNQAVMITPGSLHAEALLEALTEVEQLQLFQHEEQESAC